MSLNILKNLKTASLKASILKYFNPIWSAQIVSVFLHLQMLTIICTVLFYTVSIEKNMYHLEFLNIQIYLDSDSDNTSFKNSWIFWYILFNHSLQIFESWPQFRMICVVKYPIIFFTITVATLSIKIYLNKALNTENTFFLPFINPFSAEGR